MLKNFLGSITRNATSLTGTALALASVILIISLFFIQQMGFEGGPYLGILTFLLTLVALRILPDFFLRLIVVMITRTVYRLRIIGAENIPVEGGALIVANHASWADPILLLATTQRRIRFVMSREVYDRLRRLRPVLRLAGVIPSSAITSKTPM